MVDTNNTPAKHLLISQSAAKRIAKISAEEGPQTFLRIGVTGGGCSGFQYTFALETSRTEDDISFARDGAEVVIDPVSLDLVSGAELDFLEDLSGAFFQVKNPNATSACGCGMSFSIG